MSSNKQPKCLALALFDNCPLGITCPCSHKAKNSLALSKVEFLPDTTSKGVANEFFTDNMQSQEEEKNEYESSNQDEEELDPQAEYEAQEEIYDDEVEVDPFYEKMNERYANCECCHGYVRSCFRHSPMCSNLEMCICIASDLQEGNI